jgi:hypothetical protein
MNQVIGEVYLQEALQAHSETHWLIWGGGCQISLWELHSWHSEKNAFLAKRYQQHCAHQKTKTSIVIRQKPYWLKCFLKMMGCDTSRHILWNRSSKRQNEIIQRALRGSRAISCVNCIQEFGVMLGRRMTTSWTWDYMLQSKLTRLTDAFTTHNPTVIEKHGMIE